MSRNFDRLQECCGEGLMHRLLLIFPFLLMMATAAASLDRVHSEGYLGEKRLDSYSERYQPLIFQDIYKGRMSFEDEIFFQNYFQTYIFTPEKDVSFFLKSELRGGLACSNELLSSHFDEIRYSYRLITLSYLLEAQWHISHITNHFRFKKGCSFDLKEWASKCSPKSKDMRDFIQRLIKFNPKYEESLPATYTVKDWWKEYSQGKFQSYSHYRMKAKCKKGCTISDMPKTIESICTENKKTMDLLCSEEDEVYGLSAQRDAYYLLGLSNIINTYNKKGEAMGCLRRFSEVMSHKEVSYPALKNLFPSIQDFLRQKYEERFLQGRVFFLGAGKEFEEKGLSNLYVKDQTLKIEPVEVEPKEVVVAPKAPEVEKPEVKNIEPVKVVEAPVKRVVVEVPKAQKSAFLQASELRSSQNLDQVEVDMLKLKYDYVFTLNMMNTLSERLKTFMTREALTEMMTYDKLGTREGPVPLLFLKFMIDYQEHHGLWNIISVLGDKFYVSNEIDPSFQPGPELIQLVNDETTDRQWQIYILRP